MMTKEASTLRIKIGEDRLKLSQKAMILISVPLVFELIFVSVLFYMLHLAEIKAQQAERAKQIITTGSRLFNSLLNAAKLLVVHYAMTDDKSYLKKYDEFRVSYLDDFGRLKKLLKDDKEVLARINKVEKTSSLALSYLDEGRRQLEAGNKLEAKESLSSVKNIADELWATIDKDLGKYRKIEKESPRHEIDTKFALKRVLLVGIVLNIILAVWLARFFNKGTTSRLSILMDNTGRLKAGSELNPYLAGSDEIAELDKVFHMMADSITEASNKLKESEARIRAVIEGLPVGVLVLDREGTVQFVNPKASELFAASEAELAGTAITRRLLDSREKHVESFQQLLEKNLGHVKEYGGLKSDGNTVPVDLSISTFAGDSGYIAGVQDITERHQIEQMKQDFFAMVSHDLRTPLTSLQLSLELLKMGRFGKLTPEGEAKLNKDQASCDRLIGLINDLLDIEKLESGKMDLDLHLASLDELFERTANSVISFSEKAAVSIVIHPSELEIICDPDRIVQVLVNLVSNAIKFSPRDSSVELSAKAHAEYCQIEIRDHGRGIPPQVKDSVFERFKQVKKEDSRKHGGSGLGLAICKSIVESHGGQIGVESEGEGLGSTFWFRIPNRDSTKDDLLDDEDAD